MRLLVTFARAYPGRSLVMLLCLTLAALSEGVGLSSLLPLLGIITGSGGDQTGSMNSFLEERVGRVLDGVGLSPTLGVLLAIIVGAIVVKAGLMLLAQRQVGYTVAHVATDLRLALLRALLASKWEYYVKKPVGSLANAFATEAFRASQAYFYGASIVALMIQVVIYACVAIAASWQATIGAAVFGALAIFALSRLVGMARLAGTRQTRLLKGLLGRLTDVLYAVKPVKAMARENLIAPLLERETKQLNRALKREVLSKEALRALQEPLLVGAICLGLYVALSYFALPLDSVLLLAILFGRLLGHFNKMQKLYQAMSVCDSAFWSLHEAIDESKAQCEVTEGSLPPEIGGGISLRGVDFSYPEQSVLRDVSLEVPAGKVTVIIGPSGAGKTSIIDLVCGLVRPQAGDVYIGEAAMAEVDLYAWRRKIGYVPQETFLLHESITTNITLGDPALTPATVEAALRDAGALEFVSAMPGGVETPVGERGARLSGGQRQRIAIARALAQQPDLVILDEATASLDPASEAEVCETVRRLRGEHTILAVSHQTALLDVADRVYRLENGRVLELDPSQYSGGRLRETA